jgi:hypothetical protein
MAERRTRSSLTLMSISERTRKILWVKAGGRCSICRVQLVTEGTGTDDPSVFGEEAHIVAQAASGPRAGQVANVDSHDNLILLCSKDHKRVDDQVGYYTVDRLREMKRSHEQWIRSLVISRDGSQVSKEEARLANLAREASQEEARLARQARARSIEEQTKRLRRMGNEEKMRLHYLDDWQQGITTSAVITWQDEKNHTHERTVTDEGEALKLLRTIEADFDLHDISCALT